MARFAIVTSQLEIKQMRAIEPVIPKNANIQVNVVFFVSIQRKFMLSALTLFKNG